MRILHINCNYIGTTLHQLMIEKLDALGIQNEVFVPTYDKYIAVIKPNDNVYVSECFSKWDRLVFDYKQSKIIKAIEEHYDVKSFDLIHAYTLFTDGNAARVLSEKYGVPYVVAVRNTDLNDFFRMMIHLRGRGVKNMLEASRVFFLSDTYRRQVFEQYVSEKFHAEIQAKTEIIPNGIDDFWFDNSPSEEKIVNSQNMKLIYAGEINKNKNITGTQKAMEILRKKGINATLTVVGNIVEQEEYDKVIADKYTTYIPARPKDKLIDIYRDNDIFVMPSIYESFGLVYAEAMSQRLPVIYTKGQGFDGQFEEGTVGYRVDAKSPQSIATAIEEVVHDYDNLSQNAIHCARKFCWERIAKLYIEIYKSINR